MFKVSFSQYKILSKYYILKIISATDNVALIKIEF